MQARNTHLFPPSSTTHSCLEGYNGTIFAYGQVGVSVSVCTYRVVESVCLCVCVPCGVWYVRVIDGRVLLVSGTRLALERHSP